MYVHQLQTHSNNIHYMHANFSHKARSLSHANGFIETLLGTLEVENIPRGSRSPGLVNKDTQSTFQLR